MHIQTVGIDIAKSVFHLIALDVRGTVVVRKKFSRQQLLVLTANLQADLIGMEACCGAHFLARALETQGHNVRLMPAEYVKPYVKSNKNDFIDAEAIAEAVQRPNMRFVPVKNDEQLDLQALHRVRERWIQRKVALTNQIRGLLLERGFAVRVGSEHLWKTLPAILEDADNTLSGRFRALASALREEWTELEMKIATVTEEIGRISRSNEGCRRLRAIPGVGPSSPLPSLRQLVMPRRSNQAVISPHGWGLFRDSILRVAKRSCWESASAVISTCESCWWKAREPRSLG